MAKDAAGEPSPIPDGVRVTFGAGSADLNEATAGAIRHLGETWAANPVATFNVYAYAAGAPDDPSTPRRLSLSRALAARAVLLAEGIGSARIYPRALGSTAPQGPVDRVDVVVAGVEPRKDGSGKAPAQDGAAAPSDQAAEPTPKDAAGAAGAAVRGGTK
jgi:outer membrane protein OmpA-like peptidoglycan-associated protein